MKKVKIVLSIIILILIILLILFLNKDIRQMVYANVKNIFKIGENTTIVDFDINEITDNSVTILISIENQNGLRVVETPDNRIDINGKKNLNIDRKVNKWSTYTINVRAQGESTEKQYVLNVNQRAAVKSFIKRYKAQTQKNLEDFLDEKGAILFEENSNNYKVEYDLKVFTLDKSTLEITNETDLNDIILTGKTAISITSGKRKFDKIVGRVKSYGNITSLTVKTPSSTVEDLTPTSNYKYEYNTNSIGTYTITAKDQYGHQKSVSLEINDFLIIDDRQSLEDIKYDLSASYIIVKDIDLSDKTYTSPVISGEFKGKLDGQGHSIKNLTNILMTAKSCEVKNLKIENTKSNNVFGTAIAGITCNKVGITGTAPTGNVFGNLGLSKLYDCYARVNYTSRGTWVCGIRWRLEHFIYKMLLVRLMGTEIMEAILLE